MRKFTTVSIILLAVVSACTFSTSPQVAETPSTVTITETSSPTIKAVIIATQTPTETLPASLDTAVVTPSLDVTQKISTFKPDLVCPKQQVVPFEELDISPQYGIILLPGNADLHPENAIPLILLPGEAVPEPISDITEARSHFYEVSPDHKYFLFYRDEGDEKQETVWIRSLDDQEQWPVVQINKLNYARWASEEELFIIGSPDADEYEKLDIWSFMPFLAVNPFTLEQRQLTYIAGDRTQGRYFYGLIDNGMGSAYTLYYEGRMTGVEFYIYDYSKDEALAIFQWLKEVDPIELMTNFLPVWIYENDQYAVTISLSDGFDLALGLDLSTALCDQNYNDIMSTIILPERFLPSRVLGIVPERNWIALQRAGYLENADNSPNWFYIVDYQNNIIRDYCLDLLDSVSIVKLSPDGRFAAFSLYDFSATTDGMKQSVAILDLDLGVVNYVKGYELIDWVITNTP